MPPRRLFSEAKIDMKGWLSSISCRSHIVSCPEEFAKGMDHPVNAKHQSDEYLRELVAKHYHGEDDDRLELQCPSNDRFKTGLEYNTYPTAELPPEFNASVEKKWQRGWHSWKYRWSRIRSSHLTQFWYLYSCVLWKLHVAMTEPIKVQRYS